MKMKIYLCVAILATFCVLTSGKSDEWVPLLDKDLTRFETYLSYEHKDGYNGKVPKDASGKDLVPVGYNKDPKKVFTVLNEPEGLVLRVSGEVYGCLFTRQSYENYHLTAQVKWGKQKYAPRKDKLRDSGILYHSTGEAGAEYWRTWMLSQEFQIMEGHMGDYWCQANSAIDIRSFPSEGVMSPVADEKQPFAKFASGGNYYCMRSVNHESPADEWTKLELICFQGKSIHIVNGHVVMVLQNSRYIQPDGKEVAMHSGKIQFQSEAAEVFFRDIRIKQLSALPAEYAALFNPTQKLN